MVAQVHDIKCRNCGAAADVGQSKCLFCKQPVLISTFTSVHTMSVPMLNQYAATYKEALKDENDATDLNYSVALCYLKLKKYDDALEAFDKAIRDNFDNPEAFFYAAICVLGGKKAFLLQRPEINKIEEYLNAAMMIEPRGIFHYFQAYIKYDYFERKYLNTSPNYRESLASANSAGVSPHDIDEFYAILGVSRPDEL